MNSRKQQLQIGMGFFLHTEQAPLCECMAFQLCFRDPWILALPRVLDCVRFTILLETAEGGLIGHGSTICASRIFQTVRVQRGALSDRDFNHIDGFTHEESLSIYFLASYLSLAKSKESIHYLLLIL